MKVKFIVVVLAIILSFSTRILGVTLRIGVTPVPHGEILEFIKEDLKKEGIKLKIIEFSDFVTPNEALLSGDLDANYFQHLPHLNLIVHKERSLDIIPIAKIHIEPLGIYSKKLNSLNNLKEKSIVAIPNDSTNEGRALILLHNNGIIKLKDSNNLLATPYDIIENPKNLKFHELDAAIIPRALNNVDIAIITGNYALQAGYIPKRDALLLEGKESPYINVLAVTKEKEKDESIQKVIHFLTSEKVRIYINKKYNGAVIPAF